MSNKWKARLGVGLLAVVASMGCNPFLLTAYLFNSDDPRTPAEYPLKPQPKHEKEPVKVVVLTSCAPNVDLDMLGVDRLLASEFISLLEARCAENKENVVAKKSQIIENYKRDNVNWRSQSPYEIGQKIKNTDYVIDIEILAISLSEPRSRNLLKGRAKIAVRCYDMSKDLDEPSFSPTEFVFEYPKAYEVPREDEPVSRFRQKFIKKIAGELVLPFTAHTSQQKVSVD